MAERKPLCDAVKASIFAGISGLVLFWSWPLWPPSTNTFAVGIGFIIFIVGIVFALVGIPKQTYWALACLVSISIAAYVSALFSPMGPRDFMLAGRVAAIRTKVDKLRLQVGDGEVVRIVLTSPSIGEGRGRRVSKSNPVAVSFEVARYGLDDGANLILDPSKRIEQFIGSDDRINQNASGWETYKQLITAQPTRCKRLGNGWYLVYFT
jgi:hypothetical protein